MKKTFSLFFIALTMTLTAKAQGGSTSFIPGTGSIGWYRVATGTGWQGGMVRISGIYDNRVTDIEFQYNIGGYGAGGSIQQTRYSSYNAGLVSQVRISSNGGDSTFLDIYIPTAISPAGVTVAITGPNSVAPVAAPAVGATAGSHNVQVLTLGHGFRSTSGAVFSETAGNVGIGTSDPYSKLHLYGFGEGNGITLGNRGDLTNGYKATIMVQDVGNGEMHLFTSKAGVGHGRIFLNEFGGNVGIGTTHTPEKLTVDGNIQARRVKVTVLSTDWADYVFAKDYKLKPLNEVESFIKQYSHLPGVPSAIEVERKGLDVGANQAILLKKVEELTLYLIEQDKQVKALQEENRKMKKEMQELKRTRKP